MADAQVVLKLDAQGAAITRERFLQRVVSAGAQRLIHSTDPLFGGTEEHVGASLGTLTAAEAALFPSVSFVAFGMAYIESGAAIAVTDRYLTTDGVGRAVPAAAATDIVLANNILGQTAAGAGEHLNVLITQFVKDAV